ncbi:nuclear hormone receptor E75-like [Littorina saxatilis]|uniref:nuclear hormone receptor E75-like n=1 Tax=Littorina saxatilis TaxID=31220 RepID=UPI0038B42C75
MIACVKKCNVRGPERTFCGYCCYVRCLALGMSSTNSKTGRYSHQKRAKDITEVQQLPMRSLDALRMTGAEVDDVVQTLMSGQRSMHARTRPSRRERLKQKHEEFTFLQTLIGPHRLISHEEYSDVYVQTGLDVDGRKRRMETWMNSIENCIEGFVRFCKSIPGFCQLSIHDQTRLL